MNYLPLISVIVPVFKVEQYLDQCVESIVNQTYKNLEIILVDDGSPDNCPAMCDEWAKRDNRIKVIHKENGGGAQARNVGLNVAVGEYISFIDSDDFVSNIMIEKLYELCVNNHSQISECNYQVYTNDNVTTLHTDTTSDVLILSNEQALKENIKDEICRQLVWNKLYHCSIIESVRFTEGKTIDDEFFTYKAIANTKKMAIVSDKLYYYRQQSNSIMHQKYSLSWLAAIEAKFERMLFIKEKFPSLYQEATINLFNTCRYHLQLSQKFLSKDDLKISYNFISNIYNAHIKHQIDKNALTSKDKFWHFLTRISLYHTCKLRNLFKIGL